MFKRSKESRESILREKLEQAESERDEARRMIKTLNYELELKQQRLTDAVIVAHRLRKQVARLKTKEDGENQRDLPLDDDFERTYIRTHSVAPKVPEKNTSQQTITLPDTD